MQIKLPCFECCSNHEIHCSSINLSKMAATPSPLWASPSLSVDVPPPESQKRLDFAISQGTRLQVLLHHAVRPLKRFQLVPGVQSGPHFHRPFFTGVGRPTLEGAALVAVGARPTSSSTVPFQTGSHPDEPMLLDALRTRSEQLHFWMSREVAPARLECQCWSEGFQRLKLPLAGPAPQVVTPARCSHTAPSFKAHFEQAAEILGAERVVEEPTRCFEQPRVQLYCLAVVPTKIGSGPRYPRCPWAVVESFSKRLLQSYIAFTCFHRLSYFFVLVQCQFGSKKMSHYVTFLIL